MYLVHMGLQIPGQRLNVNGLSHCTCHDASAGAENEVAWLKSYRDGTRQQKEWGRGQAR